MMIGDFEVKVPESIRGLSQDEEYCTVVRDGEARRIRFHDYDEIYRIPGLYEYLFYERLKCTSHERVSSLLVDAVDAVNDDDTVVSDLAILELGAGNGLVGEALAERGVETIVGADIIEEAAEAAKRDRPDLYDRYYVEDFCTLGADVRDDLEGLELNCLVCVAALGFGDIPPEAFARAYNIVGNDGWVAFNIKEDFVDAADSTGFARLIKRVTDEGSLEIVESQSYRHRMSIDGEALNYVAIVGRKRFDISDATLSGGAPVSELRV